MHSRTIKSILVHFLTKKIFEKLRPFIIYLKYTGNFANNLSFLSAWGLILIILVKWKNNSPKKRQKQNEFSATTLDIVSCSRNLYCWCYLSQERNVESHYHSVTNFFSFPRALFGSVKDSKMVVAVAVGMFRTIIQDEIEDFHFDWVTLWTPKALLKKKKKRRRFYKFP